MSARDWGVFAVGFGSGMLACVTALSIALFVVIA